MQFQVVAGGAGAFNLTALQAALPTAFAVDQPAPIVPESAYGPAYAKTYQDNYVRIQDNSFSFAPDAVTPPTVVDLKSKAIQELFDPDYGRMNAILGLEIPLTNFTNQTTIPYYYVDPPSEIIPKGDTQIWKITHNGVDTHAIHFHLFNVQLINRVGWDGAIRPPDPEELGWKDTVRMNPLEDAIVALRPIQPFVPFAVPNSIRPLNVTTTIGSPLGFANIAPDGTAAPVTNVMTNFGWEYVWHCHLLGHEEDDMMRPMIFAVPPYAPTNLTVTALSAPLRAQLNWMSRSTTETGFTIQRSTSNTFPALGMVIFNVGPGVTTYTDSTVAAGITYFYRVQANTLVGAGVSLPAYPFQSVDSVFSNIAAIGQPAIGLDRTVLYFGVATGAVSPPPQTINISNVGGGTLNWTAASGQSWLSFNPTSGAGTTSMSITVVPAGLAAGNYAGLITLTAPGAANTPQVISVSLSVMTAGTTAGPFGVFETPIAGSTIQGLIPVTGWALDDVGVTSLQIWRNPLAGETPAANGYMYGGDAVFVAGARPDIQVAYPQYPFNYRAGWGYMMLTLGLPGGGNGAFVFHAIATDQDGHTVEIGSKTVTVNNATLNKPFGYIDTPVPNGVIAGNPYNNFGWALTPQPNMIPFDGSTMLVFVDGMSLGHPGYNRNRVDVAAAFPGLVNSNGAGGLFGLDTTGFANGVHTIAWYVRDTAGHEEGVGSRFFTIQNAGAPAPVAVPVLPLSDLASFTSQAVSGATVLHGYNLSKATEPVNPDSNGRAQVYLQETDRVEVKLGSVQKLGMNLVGYQVIGPELHGLPIGSSFNPQSGTFLWQTGPGFLGNFDFVFFDKATKTRMYLRVTIVPKGTDIKKLGAGASPHVR